MARPRDARSQRARNQNNASDLGLFTQTSLRLLTGRLGPENKLIGFSDTNQLSNGGYGGGNYNAWYQVRLDSPAWIILRKGETNPTHLQLSCFDVNQIAMPSRMIWDADSISVPDPDNPVGKYYPYFDTVMGAGSNLYNLYNASRLDKGNSLYFPLNKGTYVICISSTLNRDIDFNIGLVVEFPASPPFFMKCEDEGDSVFFALEDDVDFSGTLIITSPITSDIAFGPAQNAFTSDEAEIIPNGTTVTVNATGNIDNRATWWIGDLDVNPSVNLIELDIGEDFQNQSHEHSLSEWTTAWRRDHQDTDPFPDLFRPLINEP